MIKNYQKMHQMTAQQKEASSSNHELGSDFVEGAEWKGNDGRNCVLSLLVRYRKTQGKKIVKEAKNIPCNWNFLAYWNFYTKNKHGQKMFDDIVKKYGCSVTVCTDDEDFFIFEVTGTSFTQETDFVYFVNDVLDNIYKCAKQSLCHDVLSVDHRIQEDTLQRVKENKELHSAWIELVGEYDIDAMYVVCAVKDKVSVHDVLTSVISQVKECYNNHEETVAVDFMWQRVLKVFGYLQELNDRFPNIMIKPDEAKHRVVLKGPRDESKTAADHLLELFGTARNEVHEKMFSPICQFEILTYPEMCDYIDNAIPKFPVVWVPNNLTKKIHIFSKEPEQAKSIDKFIKGCIQERLYPVSKHHSLLLPGVTSLEKLKKKHKGKIVIHASDAGLLVTTADDIFETVDADIQRIISKERASLASLTYEDRVLLAGLSSKVNSDNLTNFLEVKVGLTPTKFLYADKEDKVIITFDENIDFSKLEEACKKQLLQGCRLQPSKVLICNCIIISDIKISTTEATIGLYFEDEKQSWGGPVERVEFNREKEYCLVFFEDPTICARVIQQEHHIDGSQLQVSLHYECLGHISKDDTGPSFKQPKPIKLQGLQFPKMQFVMKSELNRAALEKQLQDCFTQIQWPQTETDCITLTCTLTSNVQNCKNKALTWAKQAEQSLHDFLKLLSVHELTVFQEIFETVFQKLQNLVITNPDCVALFVKKTEFIIQVVGYKALTTVVVKDIEGIIQIAMAEFDRKNKQTKESLTAYKDHQLKLLLAANYPSKLQQKYNGLKVKINVSRNEIMFEGVMIDIRAAQVDIYEAIHDAPVSQLKQIMESLTIKDHQLKLLLAEEYPSKLQQKYNGLKVKINLSRNEIVFEGLLIDIRAAQVDMYDAIHNAAVLQLKNIPEGRLCLYKSKEVRDYIVAKLKCKKLVGVWEIEGTNLNVYANSDEVVQQIADIISDSVKEHQIILGIYQRYVVISQKWNDKMKDLDKQYQGKLRIILAQDFSKLSVYFTDDIFGAVIREVDKFLLFGFDALQNCVLS